LEKAKPTVSVESRVLVALARVVFGLAQDSFVMDQGSLVCPRKIRGTTVKIHYMLNVCTYVCIVPGTRTDLAFSPEFMFSLTGAVTRDNIVEKGRKNNVL
jgi:hypothetical protein